MCNFLSAKVLRPFEGSPLRIICDPAGTDSHSALEMKYKIRDIGNGESASVEFVPPKKIISVGGKDVEALDYENFDGYTFVLDEEREPSWWTPEIQGEVIQYLRGRLEGMIVRESTPYLDSGSWIILKGVEVGHLHGRCLYNYGDVVLNHGGIARNHGRIAYNYGNVEYNYGKIEYNYGRIESNDGSIARNYGKIANDWGAG